MWGEKSPVPVHVLQTLCTLGCTVAPLIAQPFISEVNVKGINSSINVTLNPTDKIKHSLQGSRLSAIETANKTDSELPSELIYVPYLIIGSYACLMALVFFVFACLPTPEELMPKDQGKKPFLSMFSPRSCGDGNMLFSSLFLLGLFLVYTLQVANMTSFGTYIYPIAVNTTSLKFSSAVGSDITTAYYISATLGRLFWGVLSHCISIKIIVFLEICLQLSTVIAFVLFGLSTRLVFIVLLCLSSFFMSPVYPSVMAWTDRYIEVSGLVVGVIDTGIGVGALISTYISGVIFQRFGAQSLFYFALTCASLVLVVLTSMQIGGGIHGDRYKAQIVNAQYAEDDEKSPLIN